MSNDPGLTPKELQSRAARGVTWSTVTTVVSLPLAIVVSVVLARSLGPHEFARFAYLSFLVPLLLNISDLGMAHAALRAASRSFAEGDLADTRNILGKALGWNLLRLPLACVLVLVVARPGLTVAVLLVGGLALTFAGSALLFALQAENRGATDARLAFVQNLVSSAGGMAAATVGASGTTVWAITFVSVAVAVPGWLLVANPSLRRAALTPRLPSKLPAGFWRYATSALMLALVATLVFSRSEIVILELLEEQQALAIFALAFGLAQRLTTPVDTLLGPLIPALSALASAHPDRLRQGFGRALRLSSTGVAFLGASAVVGTMLAAPVLFGPEYEGTGTVFAALAGVSLLRAAAQPYIAVAYAVGLLGGLVRVNAIALAIDIVLAIVLIPPMGVWGAVIANVVAGSLALALSVRVTTQSAGSIQEAEVPVARLLAVIGLSLVAAYACGALGGMAGPAVGALAAYAAGTGSFVVLAKLFGGLLADADANVLLDVLPGPLARLSRPFIFIATSPPADARA